MCIRDRYTTGLGHFVGLQNFIKLWKDPTFLEALKNTFIIVVVSVPTVAIFSLWVSSAIYKMKGPLLSAFRCIFYLPVVTGSVAVTVVWKWMYDNYNGIFNIVLKSGGLIDKNINLSLIHILAGGQPELPGLPGGALRQP